MTQPTDYTILMNLISEVGKEPIRFSLHRDGDTPTLLDEGKFSFLFVLEGELTCKFTGGSTIKMTAQQVMVVDKPQLRGLQCVGDTVILECVESDKMSPLMQATARAFSMSCSEIITLNTKIKVWCREIFNDLVTNPIRSNDYFHHQCCKLTALLLEYPRSVLGTLYVPLYACSNRCETCSRLFVRSEGVLV